MGEVVLKLQTFRLGLVLMAWIAVLGGLCAAQLERRELVRVIVPFEFIVGGMHLPAGQYTLEHVGGANNILLRNSDRTAQALVRVRVSTVPPEQAVTKLTFTRYGDRHFLSEVWTASDCERHSCFQCNEQLQLETHQPSAQTATIETQ